MMLVTTPRKMSRPAFESKEELVRRLLPGCNTKRRALISTVLAVEMPPIKEWPAHAIECLLGKVLHFGGVFAAALKKQFTRYDFIVFLLGNGLSPDFVVDWCTAQPGYLRHQTAVDDVLGILRKHGRQELTGWTFYCVSLGKAVELQTPTYALDEALRWKVPVVNWPMSPNEKGPIDQPKWHWEYLPGKQLWTDAERRMAEYRKTVPKK